MGRASWDYADEAPLRDARGWELGRGLADPSQLTDVEDPTMANVVLTNGARFYVDHAHPEYSSPEVTTPRDLVRWDRAGEAVMLDAVRRISPDPTRTSVALYKNNTDGKGASYGTHENYLMRRETPFADIVRHLTPFFVVRQVICGAGRVGIGQDSRVPGYQISQRADFFETEVGLETTLKRPIINTRDEPHAVADHYRRLHVIIGDANQCDVANLLKVGTTSLVLALIEDGAVDQDLTLLQPVQTLHAVSHDPTLHQHVQLRDGRTMTALELLWIYHDLAAAHLERRGETDEATAEVMRLWADVLTRLGADPIELRGRGRLGRQAATAAGLPRPRRAGLDRAAPCRAGHPVERRAAGEERLPPAQGRWPHHRARRRGPRGAGRRRSRPEDTRAWFRGTCLKRYAPDIVAASWDSVIFDVPGQASLQRVPMLEPERGTRAQVGELIERSPDAATLLRELYAGAD